jgi:mRNA interferase RelE/StbE
LPRLVLTREAHDNLAALPEPLRGAVVRTIDQLGVDPREIGRPLMGRLRGLWSARMGNYRVLYTIEGSSPERVIVRAIRHRGVAYGRRR